MKSAAILLTGDQPPVLFDLAPPLLGLSLWLLADPAERLARALGATATLTGAVGFLGEPWDNLLLVWALSLLVGLVLLRPRSSDHRFARLVGFGTVPALFLGGLLGLLRPDLVEVGLLLVGLAWAWLGVLLLRRSP